MAPPHDRYLVTTIWRGSLHITPIRTFDDLGKAWAYFDDLPGEERYKRIYQIYEDRDPIPLKR